MKKIIVFILLSNLFSSVYGQISAITQNGDKVILYNDFTWQYADNDNENSKSSGIKRIDVDANGFVKVEFIVKGNRITFYDGKLHFQNIGETTLEYHSNSFFAKSVGKIKEADFGNLSVEFEYHQNSIFDQSEGKIKSIEFGNEEIVFGYHEISFYKYSVGKIKSISKGSNTVYFEYHQNSIYPENEGKLKEINGEIPGIKIRYLE